MMYGDDGWMKCPFDRLWRPRALYFPGALVGQHR